MDHLPQRLGAVALAASLLFGLAACGGSDSSDGADADTSATAASGAGSGTDGGSGDDAPAATDCAADTAKGDSEELMSGSASVMWTVDSKATHAMDEITPEKTMTFADDGTLSPETLDVSVDEVFGIAGSPDNAIRAVKVGCADGQTIVGSAPGGFYVTVAGTYDLVEELSGDTVGAVTAA